MSDWTYEGNGSKWALLVAFVFGMALLVGGIVESLAEGCCW